MRDGKRSFVAGGKTVTLYPGKAEAVPLVVLNTYTGDGSSVAEAMDAIDTPDCNLLVVGNLAWDHDMTPWYCPPTSKGDTPCTGGATEYLMLLVDGILPQVMEHLDTAPVFTGIAGYSLAGLFALWSAYNCDAFARVASMSGSLWFPDFVGYATSHDMAKRPEKLYLSLGDTEARTRNRYLRTVQDNTETLAMFYETQGINVAFEQNPGNHFKDPALRSAKGIKAILT